MPIIAEGSYQPAYQDSSQVYAFERELNGQKLLVLNNFYAEPVSLDLPEVYQTGRVLISNYENVELGQEISLAPYQTLAILVD